MDWSPEKILEKFSINQRMWALITIGIVVISLAGIKIIPTVLEYKGHKSCRAEINTCNKEYQELAGTVREYIRMEQKAAISFENQADSSLVPLSEPTLTGRSLNEVEEALERDSIIRKMQEMTVTNWVIEQGNKN